MIRRIVIGCLLSMLAVAVSGQSESTRFSYAAVFGTGVSLSSPSSMPFVWRFAGYYMIGDRLAVGAGSGISVYEKALLPLFADLKFRLSRPRTFTPYLRCGAGYSLALADDANGGVLINPEIGLEYRVGGKFKLLLNLGYEIQRLERLKTYRDGFMSAGFAEKLRHHSLMISFGVLFR